MSECATRRQGTKIRRVTVDLDVDVPMRDGVVLRADIYRPAASGPWSVLVVRTPYGKSVLLENQWNGISPVDAAREGFIVVIQDTRGRGASDGRWLPLLNEGADGVDTIEWAAHLDGSTGRVGMFGGSYCGNTQWQPAIAAAPSLRAIAPAMTWSEPADGLFTRGGAVEIGLALYWSLLTGADNAHRDNDADALQRGRRLERILDEIDSLAFAGYWELPAAAPVQRHAVAELGTFTRNPIQTSAVRVRGHEEHVHVAGYHTAGWYDVFLQGTLDNYRAQQRRHPDTRLVVGPWTHLSFQDPIGDLSFGTRSGRDTAAVHDGRTWAYDQLRWLHTQLGATTGSHSSWPGTPVRVFVMGLNEWRDERTWPPDRAIATRFHFQAGGELSVEQPSHTTAFEQYRHDAANPVPTVGGNTLLSPEYLAGPRDQRAIENRADVLCFTSLPLDRDLEVTGRVTVTLHARSSVSSTDWVARLCDVHPDGRSFNICDGIRRVAERADEWSEHTIDLWSTSNVFRRGHRLRVHITSSSFPRWDRNFGDTDQSEVASHHVATNARRASYIELPIIAT